MLLYVCFVLVAWKGVMGKPTLCNEPSTKVCNSIRDLSFPRTEADVDLMCPKIIKHLDCLQGYSEKCGSESDMHLLLPGMKNLAEDGCRKDSPLHLSIVQNIGCFHDEIQYEVEACGKYGRDKSAKVIEYIRKLEAERGLDEAFHGHELWRPLQCLGQSLEMSCLASKSSEKCGPDAEDVFLEVVGRAGLSGRYCASSSEFNLSKILTLLELEPQEEASMSRFFRRE